MKARRRRGIRISALVLGLALTAAACGGGGSGGDDEEAVSDGDDATSEDAPSGAAADLPTEEFELVREVELADGSVLAEGDTATLADLLDGRPVVLNFFASWCPPCRAEMPDLEKVFQDVQGEVNFVGFTQSDAKDDAADLVEEVGVSYPWAHDGTLLYAEFGLFGMPSTILISPEGEVLEENNGLISEDQFREQLAEQFGVET